MRLTGSKLCVFCDAAGVLLYDNQIKYDLILDESKLDYPTLEFHAFGICGFIAISEYVQQLQFGPRALDESFQLEKRNYIENLKKESNKRMWLFVALNEIWYGCAHTIIQERVRNVSKGIQSDYLTLKQARKNLQAALQDLNTWLSENIYIVDINCYTDTLIATIVAYMDYLSEVDWTKYKHLKSWYSAMKTKPSFKILLNKSIAGHQPPSWYRELDF